MVYSVVMRLSGSILPKITKPPRRQFGVADGVGDVLVSQVVLDGAGVVAVTS